MASTTASGLLPAAGQAHAPGAPARAEVPTVPAHMLPHRTPAQLLTIARASTSATLFFVSLLSQPTAASTTVIETSTRNVVCGVCCIKVSSRPLATFP